MRQVTLFIAMSLDGYIADRAGNIDWLSGQVPGADDMVSYQNFIKEIDTVIMGWNTYHQIVSELSPDEWPYHGLKSYVVTHRQLPSTREIQYVNEDVGRLVKTLRSAKGRGIWICGGAQLVNPLISENLIDRYHISVIPTLLGDGIRLFEKRDSELKLQCIATQTYNGITDLIYERRLQEVFHK